jgi:hypothetical protein
MALSKEMLALLEAKKAKIAARSGEKAVRLKPGKNRIRIYPSKDPNDPQWWADFGQHWIKGPDGKVIAVIGCRHAAFDEPCETCDTISAAITGVTDDETMKLLVEAKKVPRRVLVVAAHRLSDHPDKPVITELPSTVFTSILNTIIQYADEFGDVLDMTNGLDFIIEKTGSGMDTDYSTMPAPTATPAPKAVLVDLPDLKAYVQQEGQFEINKAKMIAAVSKLSGEPPLIGAPVSRTALTGPSTAAKKSDPVVIENEPRALPADVEADEIPAFASGKGGPAPEVAEMNAAAEKAKAERAARVAAAKAALAAAEAEEASLDAEVAAMEPTVPVTEPAAAGGDNIDALLDQLELED